MALTICKSQKQSCYIKNTVIAVHVRIQCDTDRLSTSNNYAALLGLEFRGGAYLSKL